MPARSHKRRSRRPASAKPRKHGARARPGAALRRSRRRPAKMPRPRRHGHLRKKIAKLPNSAISPVFLQTRTKSSRAKVRKNADGEVTKAWVCPNGEVLPLPYRSTHLERIPHHLRAVAGIARAAGLAGPRKRAIVAEVNRRGFYPAAIINGRLYVAQGSAHAPAPAQVRALRAYAIAHGLDRGIVIERQPVA